MESSVSMEYIKAPILQYAETSELKMSSFPWMANASITKPEEIFPVNNGQYSFMCFNCGITFEEITNHCNTHFDNDVKCDIRVQTPEFLFCAETDPNPPDLPYPRESTSKLEMTALEYTIESHESTHFTIDPDVTVRRRRNKSKTMLDVPRNCPVCVVWCDDFQGRLKTMHGFSKRIYQCFICSKFFKRFIALQKHISCTNHTKSKCYHCEMEPPITKPSELRRYKCLFCKEWFKNHIELKIHFKEAHNKDADYFFHKRSNCNIFTCYVCEREFPLRYYLTAHMKTHHDKFLRHQCPSSGKRVRTFGQLTQHLKTHEGKIFQSDQCDKQFPYFAKLRLHLWCHKTELKYKCDICSKAFKTRTYLTRHMAVHDKLKKYTCRFCEASFSFSSGRRAHEKSQHKAM